MDKNRSPLKLLQHKFSFNVHDANNHSNGLSIFLFFCGGLKVYITLRAFSVLSSICIGISCLRARSTSFKKAFSINWTTESTAYLGTDVVVQLGGGIKQQITLTTASKVCSQLNLYRKTRALLCYMIPGASPLNSSRLVGSNSNIQQISWLGAALQFRLLIFLIMVVSPDFFLKNRINATQLRLPYSLGGVFSYQPLTLLIRVGYPQTYISMESL